MSAIKTLETILHLEDLVRQADENTLVLFDVGDVLLIPEEALLQGHTKVVREKLRADYLVPLGNERHMDLWSLVLNKEKRQLVERQTPQVIKNLQEKKVKVMALTAMQTGKFGPIENMEDWRLAHLSGHGINFSKVSQDSDHFVFEELLENGLGPVYKKGALFAYRQSKGLVLTTFLNRIGWMPKHIVFVDDKRANIEDVAAASKKLSIPYTGVHYQVATRLLKSLDEKLAQFRFKHLSQNGIWLTEDEAREHKKQENTLVK